MVLYFEIPVCYIACTIIYDTWLSFLVHVEVAEWKYLAY